MDWDQQGFYRVNVARVKGFSLAYLHVIHFETSRFNIKSFARVLFFLQKFPRPSWKLPRMHIEDNRLSERALILGDPGAVSRAGLKGATKVFKHGRKSPWIPTLIGPFPKGQGNAGSWLGTKNALYYSAQSANSFSWVLFVSSYTTAIISPQLPGSFTKLS